ncbi:MAG TPA: hypothetical protein VLW17_12870 [Thermoanaerobaculaceae bacterium]|nr:hypothetical protein [Thermoanaerobaculaceae bacterium]
MGQRIPRRRRLPVVAFSLLTAVLVVLPAFADDDEGHHNLHIYNLLPPLVDASCAASIAEFFDLKPVGGPSPAAGPAAGPMAFEDANGVVRMLFADGSVKVFPDLAGLAALTTDSHTGRGKGPALGMAERWIRSLCFSGKGQPPFVPDGETTLTTEQGTMPTPSSPGATARGASTLPAVQLGAPHDVLKSVQFVRKLDGLPVLGPDSILDIDVGAQGVAGGVIDLRGIDPRGKRVRIISEDQALKLFLQQFPYPVTTRGAHDGHDGANPGAGGASPAADPTAVGLSGRLQSIDLIYYEQGQGIVQPAFLFDVLIVGPTGMKAGMNWLVPAVQDTPEPILNHPPTQGPQPIFATPGTELPALVCQQPPDVKYGRYVLRQDDPGWLIDAQGFGSNIDAANGALRFWLPSLPPVNDFQFYWNYPWLWEPAGSPPTDQSPYFPGSVNMALIEGHGGQWIISTLMNCCDVIDLPKITGFGGYHDPGEITDYVIWQSCDVIPAPGDPYGFNYKSPDTPFDVWFTIFDGLRGTYGYHTTMNIWNGVGEAFGGDVGFGAQNLSAWFTECDNNVFHHGGGWNYGSAVLISGHEGDTLYDTCPLPPPGSLTIWWQHP